jgi:hypothetical protein
MPHRDRPPHEETVASQAGGRPAGPACHLVHWGQQTMLAVAGTRKQAWQPCRAQRTGMLHRAISRPV